MIEDVFVEPEAVKYVRSHQLDTQFHKAVAKLIQGSNAGLDLKKRKPHAENIWSFRITKKYRAFAHKREGILTVYDISDHQ
jgi:hypothetical protein